jgi:hypothetical protein
VSVYSLHIFIKTLAGKTINLEVESLVTENAMFVSHLILPTAGKGGVVTHRHYTKDINERLMRRSQLSRHFGYVLFLFF